MNTKKKGQRNCNKCINRLLDEGWLAEKVEKSGRFIKIKDLYSLWDVMAIKPNRTKLVQVKTNAKPLMKRYINFQKAFPQFECEVWVYMDRKEVKIINLRESYK